MAKRASGGKRRKVSAKQRANWARFARMARARARAVVKRAKSRRAGRRRGKSGGGRSAPVVLLGPGGSFTRGYNMARKRRGGRRRASGRRRSGGGGGFGIGRLGGFFSRDVAAVVGGSVAAGFAAPWIASKLPASMANSAAGRIGAALVTGFAGYFLLKRINRSAALGWVAATVAPAVSAEVRSAAGLSGIAYGSPDGVDYLPAPDSVAGYLGGDTLELAGDDDLEGVDDMLLGYDAEAVEV